jgi:hypothetical protein
MTTKQDSPIRFNSISNKFPGYSLQRGIFLLLLLIRLFYIYDYYPSGLALLEPMDYLFELVCQVAKLKDGRMLFASGL